MVRQGGHLVISSCWRATFLFLAVGDSISSCSGGYSGRIIRTSAKEQIMPLEDRLSPETLERLKGSEEVSRLPEYERHICQVFLPLDFLYLRWRTLRLARELADYEEKFLKPMAMLSGSLKAVLRPEARSSGEKCDGRELWPEAWPLRRFRAGTWRESTIGGEKHGGGAL